MKTVWYFIALLAGAFLPLQAGLNTKLGKAIESPVYASMISFIVGAMALFIYILLTKQTVALSGLKPVPVYVYLSGALGAFYVTAIILAFPKIAPALTFGLVVTGQMIMSMILEHFKILVGTQNSISIPKILGVILIIAGVIIIRKF